MKKRVIILMLASLCFTSSVCFADESMIRSKIGESMDVDNGRAWATLDSMSKVSYVKGFSLGMTFGGAIVSREFSLQSDEEKERAGRALDENTPNKASWSEIVEYIDEIYKNPLNRPLTILDAYLCMSFEQKGRINKNNRDEFIQKIIAAYQE